MTGIIPLEEVVRVRQAVSDAHEVAAAHFRSAFDKSDLPPEQRWGVYMHIRADALLASAKHIRLRDGRIVYEFDGRAVTPYVVAGEPVYKHFEVPRRGEAIFEYFVLVSEIFATPAWNLTRVVASAADYDIALNTMKQPQIVDATFVSFLPVVDIRDDGTAMLHVTLYTRAGEERVERRTLALDATNEFRFHSRTLVCEGRAGVVV